MSGTIAAQHTKTNNKNKDLSPTWGITNNKTAEAREPQPSINEEMVDNDFLFPCKHFYSDKSIETAAEIIYD